MRLARELPKLPEAQRVAHLSIRDAVAQLARQAQDLVKLPETKIAEVIEAAHEDRLQHQLACAINEQRRVVGQICESATEWTSVALPPSLPPPDERPVARLAEEIQRHDLPPTAVLESLNALYCRIQNQHQLVTRAGLPGPIEEEERREPPNGLQLMLLDEVTP
jgi:hypothetical protein